nr:sigma-54-dependent Fis family transcriptional regulator [Deltaproteobacteria bacterium]
MTQKPTSSQAPSRARILVVDDEATARRALATLLTDEGYEVAMASSGEEALEQVSKAPPDILLTDVRMSGIDGIELLTRARAMEPGLAVVVMTAFGTVRDAVQAMRAGAEHYVTKPIDFDELGMVLARVLERRAERRETSLLREQVRVEHRFENLLGSSVPMQSLFKSIRQVAPARATVLLLGESGTGKERVAQALHHSSPRKDAPFVKLHCAALAETLLESELFGHERGAFTGASTRREGRFKMAHGGTLFLDEISEITPAIQVKLLRVLQEREFERVGGNETLKVDVRIIAATNRDLAGMVRDGRFREDLYYRLNVVNLSLPPLRARRADIPLLADHFLRRYSAEAEREILGFTHEALMALQEHNWPGNVRELENTIERAVVLCTGERIELEDLTLPPSLTMSSAPVADAALRGSIEAQLGAPPPLPGARLDEIERYAILSTLEACEGSTHRAADILGVSVRMIQYRTREYRHGIKREHGSEHRIDHEGASHDPTRRLDGR